MTGMIKLPGHDLSLLYNRMRGEKKKIKPSSLLLLGEKKKPFLAYWRLYLCSEKKFSIHSLLWTIKELATNRAFTKELIIVSEKTITYPNGD